MSEKRNYGLDLLRIMSMIGIIGLHVFNNGGALNALNVNSISYYLILLIFTFCYLSVNIFAMLSGYLYIGKKDIKYNNIFHLITTVLFYCIIITVIFYGFNLYNIRTHGIVYFISSIFPPIVGRYWYITSYILLFFMIPYINMFILKIPEEKFKKMLIILFVLLSIIPTLIGLRDFFAINNGYSPFWLIYCYMIGAYIKLYMTKYKRKYIYTFLLMILLAWGLNSIVRFISMNLFGKIVLNDIFINYISPFNIIASLYLLIIFEKISIENKHIKAVIKFFSSTSFAVYIIHSHILIFDFILKDAFISIGDNNILVVLLILSFTIMAIYIVCSIIDFIKIKIFDLLKINVFINFVSDKIQLRIE